MLVDLDGVTHVNAYSKGNTELGRWLSNFTKAEFYHPQYGRFTSMEGFWYWCSTGRKHTDLRNLYGYQAKLVGRGLTRVPNPMFEHDIRLGLLYKVLFHDRAQDLIDLELPIDHYIVSDKGVVRPKSNDVFLGGLAWVQRRLRGDDA